MNRIFCAFLALVAVQAGPLHAQTSPAQVSLPRTERTDIPSRINEQAYRVYVALPQAYANEPSARYPVIYLTDAPWIFGLTVQTHVLLRMGKLMPEAIIVGVSRAGLDEGNAESRPAAAARVPDLTPTKVTDQEERFRREYERSDIETGRAGDFLRVLRDEVVPDIERRYRTNGDRTYVGYSLGGLFGAYALFHAPELFQRMVLVSPSLWWDDQIVARYEETYANSHKTLNVRLFMSDGEQEGSTMIGPMLALASKLNGREYPGLQLKTRIFEGESHMTTFPVALTRGLTTVFSATVDGTVR